MKILDLGCSDLAIGAWIKQNKDLPITRIDGIDLDGRMVKAAKERAIEHGIEGEYKVGNALEAATLFPDEKYDAVVAYELIEHAPDPDALLKVCEEMLTPEGRIYISTPDGTFGTGNNPHHLRVFTTSTLYDLLRTHGKVHDAIAGDDGVAVIAYTPQPKKGKIAIYTGPSWEQWLPQDIETKGLGGSETAATRLAEHLAQRGWIVTVFGDHPEPVALKDALFKGWQSYDPQDQYDCVIASRVPAVFDRPTNAKKKLLWVHDIDCGEELTSERAKNIDHVLSLSRFHSNHLIETYPFIEPKLVLINNAINHSYFRLAKPLVRQKRVLYTSSPDRGLDTVLEAWPAVIEEVPDAQLNYCYSAVYDAVARTVPSVQEHRDRIKALQQSVGNHKALGSLSQPALAKLMCESMVWVHPSHTPHEGVRFFETSCIGGMEAQAAGLVCVTADWGALTETISPGVKIALTQENRKDLIKETAEGIVTALTDTELQTKAATLGPAHAASYSWSDVAERIEDLINS